MSENERDTFSRAEIEELRDKIERFINVSDEEISILENEMQKQYWMGSAVAYLHVKEMIEKLLDTENEENESDINLEDNEGIEVRK